MILCLSLVDIDKAYEFKKVLEIVSTSIALFNSYWLNLAFSILGNYVFLDISLL